MNLMLRRMAMMSSGPKEQPNYLCFTALEDGSFTLKFAAGLNTTFGPKYIEYSIDGGKTWVHTDNVDSTEVTVTTPTISQGGMVYWRGSANRMATNSNTNSRSVFSSTGRYSVSGNLNSLRTPKDFENIYPTIGGEHVFNGLFLDNIYLVSVDELILVPSNFAQAYRMMFQGCTSLVDTPDFTNVGVIGSNSFFYGMFYGCISLKTVKPLPFTTLKNGCYQRMFYGCTSLENAPQLPATTIVGGIDNGAYQDMFSNCTSLVNVPDIYVSEFSGTYCMSSMFFGCTSLVHCPIKSVPDDAPVQCFSSMFKGCTNLVDAFELPALVLNIYSYVNLFRDTKVSYIKMLATDISATGSLNDWVRGLPSSGIFVKHIDATWTTTGYNGVPTNWTVIYYDPALDKYYLDQQRQTECDDHGNPI